MHTIRFMLELNLSYPIYNFRGKIMVGLLGCRSHHPYYQALLQGLQKYHTYGKHDKHWYAENIYQHIYYPKYKDSRGPNGLHVETDSKYFLPTFDPMLKNQIVGRCSRNWISQNFKSVCVRLKQNHFSNLTTNDSFTNHFWVHLDGNHISTRRLDHVDVRKVVPEHRWMNVTREILLLT